MILWTYKLISAARRAIAGRKYPHQLAWAVAFGLLLGVIPHGNLLAVAVLLVVLSLKINHAMAGLTAIGTTFLATHLDPYSNQVGDFVLGHPQMRETATAAWQLPMVPWTDLNNTVVMGSFLIGVAALLPVFIVTYPVFKLMAPRDRQAEGAGKKSRQSQAMQRDSRDNEQDDQKAHQLVLVDQGHATVAPPHSAGESTAEVAPETPNENSGEPVKFVEVEDPKPRSEKLAAIETRIDVIRMKDHRNVSAPESTDQDELEDNQPMDEALSYLLRQLRDSQQRKAA